MREKRNLNGSKMTRMLFLIFAFIGIVHCAKAQIIDQGTCGENLTWVLTSDSVLTISGTGAMSDYYINAPWDSYREQIKAVVINQGATTIGTYAFIYCYNLISIELPNSIKTIGNSAFFSCSKLATVTIPNSVTLIEISQTFDGCSSLTAINVDANNPNYSSEDGILFNKSKTTLIRYPSGKTEDTFATPSSVTTIGSFAFRYNGNIKSIVVSNSVKSIEYLAFGQCWNLISMKIGNSVSEIAVFAFPNTSLSSIIVDAANPYFCSIDGILYNKSQTTLILCPERKAGRVIIPNSVSSIRLWAFHNCVYLTSIIIPNSTNEIEDYAFSFCSNLDTIICKATTPPKIMENTFSNIPSTVTFFVPCISIGTYKTTEYWSFITNYEPINKLVEVLHLNNTLLVRWFSSETTIYEVYRNNILVATIHGNSAEESVYEDTEVKEGINYCYKVRTVNGLCAGTTSDEVCVTFTNVGIKEQNISNFLIYPNPTKETIFINCENHSTIKLYDMFGKEVLTQNVNGKIIINISHLPNGIYSVRVFSENNVIGNSKIVKQ